MAYLALFLALGGTTAYAANTIGTGDIIDNQVTSADVRDDNLGFGGLAAQDLGPGSVRGSEVQDNSLTGADVDESSLNLAPTTTATFAGRGEVAVTSAFSAVVTKNLPAGSYAIAATANLDTLSRPGGGSYDAYCELRNHNGAFIGGGKDERVVPAAEDVKISLSMNGGVQIPAGGGQVGVYCRYGGASAFDPAIADAQMMVIRLDGFF